ncbi:MAG: DNA repair protein RecO [Candidatus Kerfeldbacteria bacterium]|nr:DNA repair protein RecO [Candidatus Kerfeldbacteria bacterium]
MLYYRAWREADRVYTVYSETAGKQIVRGHGVRKLQSKLAGSLEPFAEIDLYLIAARQRPKIGGAVIRHRFKHITAQQQSWQAAHWCTQLVGDLTPEGAADTVLYQLLYEILAWIDQTGAHRTVLCSFACKVIRVLGYDLAAQTNQSEVIKIIQWLTSTPYQSVQKLRLTNSQWQGIVASMQRWLIQHGPAHVQANILLV